MYEFFVNHCYICLDFMDNQQQYQVQGQTNFQGRGVMNTGMNRPMFNKQNMGYVMNGPNNMGNYMAQQRNPYMQQQGMTGEYDIYSTCT